MQLTAHEGTEREKRSRSHLHEITQIPNATVKRTHLRNIVSQPRNELVNKAFLLAKLQIEQNRSRGLSAEHNESAIARV